MNLQILKEYKCMKHSKKKEKNYEIVPMLMGYSYELLKSTHRWHKSA